MAPQSILGSEIALAAARRQAIRLIFFGWGFLCLSLRLAPAQNITPEAQRLFQQADTAAGPNQKTRLLESALRLAPQYVDARLELAKTLIEMQQYRRALSHLDTSLNYDFKNPNVWYWKGRAHHAQGDTANAAKSYRRAVKLQPNFSEATTYLSRIENQPKLEAWYQAAEDAFRRNDWRSAETNYKRILEIAPDFRDAAQKLTITRNKIKAQTLFDSAQTLRQQQKFDEAIKLLQEAIGIDPERKTDFQAQIKQIEQEKITSAQTASKSEKPVEIKKPLPLVEVDTTQTLVHDTTTKHPPADSLPNKPASERIWQSFSIRWIAAVGTALLMVVIVVVFVQKYRTKSKVAKPNKISPRPTDIPPPKLDRYRIEEELGHGGMGRVYKAYDLKLERHVALKVIHLETAIDQEEREERIARFRREAKAIAKLNHPNIVSLYDYDEISGMLYMTMEYVDGPSIEQMLKEKKQLAVHAAAQIIRQACMALAYAHRNGTIHRDIKPSNIMLSKEDIVKVVDFGVAKMLAAVETKFHTLAGMRLGSPPYMSPEQIEAKDIDGRTDIYSLGTVFYEMLTGVKPFIMNECDNLSSLFYAILHTDPPKLTLARPEVPATLEAIVEKMLAKKHEQRYQNANLIIDELSQIETER